MYLARDFPAFVMYCVNGESRSSLIIESTDSMITQFIIETQKCIVNPREGYGSCPVCVSVCLSVRNLNLGTGASRGLNEGTSE